MKKQNWLILIYKKKSLLLFSSFLLTTMLLSCSDVPENPYKVSNVSMSLLLQSSDFTQSDNMITDSTGHMVRMGLNCYMPKFIDSLRLKILVSGNLIEKDTVFKNLRQTTSYDTIWYPYLFAYSGTRSVQITAYVEDSTTIYKSGVVVINGLQNKKPSLVIKGSRNPLPNSPCTLSVEGSDDGQNLKYSYNNYPAGSTFVNQKFIWTPLTSDSGIFNVTFKVTDDGLPPLSDSVTVSLVIDLSLPRPLKPQGLVVVERKAASVQLKWNTTNNTDSYQVYRSAGGAYVLRNSIFDTSFTDVIDGNAFLYYVSAKNRIGEVSSDTVSVSSLNLSKPVWNSDSFNISISEGQQYYLSLPSLCKVTNSDSLKFQILSVDSLADTITPQKVYMYTPGFSDSGIYSIVIGAKNIGYTDTFKINVHVVNVNRAPVFLKDLPQTSQFVLEGGTLTVPFNTVDPDGDKVTYYLKNVTLPRSATVELSIIDGVFRWQSVSGDSGNYKVDIVADDGIDSSIISVNIFVGKGNVAPSWNKDSMTVTVNEADAYELDIEAISVDLNNDTLRYSVISGQPANDTVIGNKYVYSPKFTDSGTYVVKLLVSDSLLSDTMKLTVKVLNKNRAPEISGVKDTTLLPSKSLTDTVVFIDPDNDPLTISVSALPSGAVFNPSTGLFTFGSSAQGTYVFKFIATDGKDSTEKNIAITVSTIAGPSITLQPQSVTTCAGQPAILSTAATGAGTLNYQWRKDGSAINGKTSAALTFNVLTPSDSGSYDCVVMNAGGQVTSSSAKLAVSIPSVSPTNVTANPATFCIGNSSILKVIGGTLGTGASKWKWYSDRQCTDAVVSTGSGLIKNIYNTQITVTPASGGTFKYYVRSEGMCNTTIDSVTLTVMSLPAKPVPMKDTTITLGDTVELTASLLKSAIIGSGLSVVTRTSVNWYTGGCGEIALTSTKVAPGTTTTYYVNSENGYCSSACDSVKVTVKKNLIIDPFLPVTM
jgi:hypothetical protein